MTRFFTEPRLRPCFIKKTRYTKVKALFHCWNQQSDIYAPSPMIGGHPGGVIASTYGIVELEDGSIIQVKPEQIIFDDGLFKCYGWLSDCEEKNK